MRVMPCGFFVDYYGVYLYFIFIDGKLKKPKGHYPPAF